MQTYLPIQPAAEPQRIQLSERSWIERGMIPLELQATPLDALWNLHPPTLGQVKMFGKCVDTPRYLQSYEQPYAFSNADHPAMALPALLRPFKEWAMATTGQPFNQVLVNWYENGLHYIGRHSDNEVALVPDAPIMSISMGATRTFRLRDKASGRIVRDMSLPNGTYVIMGGALQREFTHEVLKITGGLGKNTPPRINITMRVFKKTPPTDTPDDST